MEIMKRTKADLSALNHMPLHKPVTAYKSRPEQGSGLMNLCSEQIGKHEVAERPSFFRRILGRKTA